MRRSLFCVMLVSACAQSARELNPGSPGGFEPGCFELQIRSDSLSPGMGILADSMPGTLALRLTGESVPTIRLKDSIGPLLAEYDREYGTATGGWYQHGDSLRIRFRSIYMRLEFKLRGTSDSLRGWGISETHRGFYERALVSAHRQICVF